MPDAIITSTASTFGTITGTFSADQSTITGTVTGIITGTLDGSVGVPGVGVPDGGTTGQVLQKATNTSYDTVWATPSGGAWGTITGTLSNQTDLQTALNLKAPLASPALTGVPTAPTAATLTSTTQLATTAFVQQELLSGTANAKNLEVYVRNQTGATLTAGSIVYINGATGNRPTVTKAQANNDANSAQTFGFVKTSIANNGFGFVIVRGELENVDTSALTEGVQLYLSPTTAGTWTTTKPSAPQHLVYVGIVVRAHPTQGVILVAVQNGYELNELHDVQITSPTNGQVLKYNSSTSLWYNGLDVGIPVGGTAGQFLTKIDGTDYNTDWTTVNLSVYAVKSNNLSDLTSASTARTNLGLGTMATATASDYSTTTVANGLYYPLSSNPAAYLTASSLTPYLTKADNLGSLTNFATARDNLGLGTLNNPTFAGVTVQGAGANVANLTPTSLSLTHATSGSFTIQPSVGITFPDASVQTTAFTGIPAGYITSVSSPLSVTSGNLSVDLSAYLTSATAASTYQTLSGMSSYLTTSAAASTYLTQSNAASTYQTLSGMSSYLTTSTAASTYATKASPTFTGLSTFNNPGNYAITLDNSVGNYTSISSGVYSIYASTVEVIRLSAGGIKYPDGVTQSVAYPGASGFLLKADNLSGLANTGTARTNLGLGTMAVETASNYLTTATASSTYQTLSGMSSYLTTASAASTYFTIASAANKADLASPGLTGVPTAPTAAAATNTTQIATTAFVQQEVPAASTTAAGKVELATLAEIITGTDTARVMPVSQIPVMTASPYLRALAAINATSVSGAAAVTAASGEQFSREAYLTSGAAGRASFQLGFAGTANAQPAFHTANFGQINFSNKIVVSGTTVFGITGYPGNASTQIYVTLGGYNANTTGDMTQKGIGIKKVGGTSSVIQLIVHNGTSQTSVSTSVTSALAEAVNWTIYSDGTGNVTLYINGSQAATTSAGPTGTNTTGNSAYREQVECPSGGGTNHSIHSVGGWVYIRP